MVSPATKRKHSLMRQAASASNRRRAGMTRLNALVQQIALAALRNKLSPKRPAQKR